MGVAKEAVDMTDEFTAYRQEKEHKQLGKNLRRAAYAGEEWAIAILDELDVAIERFMALREMYLELLDNPDELARLEIEHGVKGKAEVFKAACPVMSVETMYSLISEN